MAMLDDLAGNSMLSTVLEMVNNQPGGIAPETASSQLTDVLPGLVDKLTPGGELPQGDIIKSGTVYSIPNCGFHCAGHPR
jgi:uncharacterized protein YidB (DUF937 family)